MNGTEIYKSKAKDSEIVATALCLGNISKDWSTNNMKRTGFNGYVYEFNVDYTDLNKIGDYITKIMPFIHKYLITKYNII